MKANIITIIKGVVIENETLTFNTKSEYKNYIGSLSCYLADKEMDIISKNQPRIATRIMIDGIPANMICSKHFCTITMDGCVIWKNDDVTTMFVNEECPINLRSVSAILNK